MKGGARIVSGFDRGLADGKKGCWGWVVEGLDDMGSCGCGFLAGRGNKFLEWKADVEGDEMMMTMTGCLGCLARLGILPYGRADHYD